MNEKMKGSLEFKEKLRARLLPYIDSYVPRGIIFVIDIFLSMLAVFVAFYLVASIKHTPFRLPQEVGEMGLILLTQAVFFLIFKSYAGLIRFSGLRDMQKQLLVVAVCVATLLVLNPIYYFYSGNYLISVSKVVMYGVFAFPFLFLFRVIVKGVYGIVVHQEGKKSCYVLGIDRDDVAMASGLIGEGSNDFSISGFINIEKKTLRNRIFGLPIYTIEELKLKQDKDKILIVREDRLVTLRAANQPFISELLDLHFKIFKFSKLLDIQDESRSKFDQLKQINIEDLLQRSPIKLTNNRLNTLYKGKVILVSGAAGSIGSEIVRQLIPFEPENILLVDQAETPLHLLSLELQKRYPLIAFKKIIGNVRNKSRMEQIFERYHPDVVFHAAAYKHVPMMESNIGEALSVNFRGTHIMADLALRYAVQRFVFISTDKAVNPTNIMGATKRAAELYIQSLAHRKDIQTTFITTRFGNVLGSNGSVVPFFKKQIAEGGPITVTHPEIIRYFMTIDEACQLVLEAGGMGKGGEIFVFDMGNPVKIVDLAKQMIHLCGLEPEKDIEIKFVGLRPGEKLFEELLSDGEKTMPTHHEKIMIGTATYECNKMKVDLLNDLLETVKNYDCEQSLLNLKALVPEYHREDLHPIEKIKEMRV